MFVSISIIIVLQIAVAAVVVGQEYHLLPPLRDIADIQQQWLDERLATVVPNVMRENDVDMWILSMREYGEDTLFRSMKRPTQFAARRRTVWIFEDNGARHEFVDNTDQVWDDIYQVVQSADPQTIALNINDTFTWSDGLHAGEREVLEVALKEYASRIVRRPRLGLDYAAIRVDGMLPVFQEMVETVHAIIKDAMSRKVITPGVTTTDDVAWWFRDTFQALNMTTWFQPSFSFARQGQDWSSGVIQQGDLLWCDVGIEAYGLCTDTQHIGYVLKDGEIEAPAGLQAGLHNANLVQDILMVEIQVGKTGNEILATTLTEMERLGLTGTVYCHPLGDHGHAAGTLIGMTNLQDGVPVRGDVPVIPNTWYSIEHEVTSAVPEWGGQLVSFRQEEDMHIDANGRNAWVYARQQDIHLVQSVAPLPPSLPLITLHFEISKTDLMFFLLFLVIVGLFVLLGQGYDKQMRTHRLLHANVKHPRLGLRLTSLSHGPAASRPHMKTAAAVTGKQLA